MSPKYIIGYFLLAIGVLVICYALFASYSIFTGGSDAPDIFEEPVISQSAGSVNAQNVEVQVDALLQQQLTKLLPQDTISKTLNLFVWSVFAGLLVFGGAQLASLGIKLLRIPQQEN